MNAVALILSVVVLSLALDRIRVINWLTARAYANVQYLLHAAIGFWGLWSACTDDVAVLLWVLLAAAALWLVLTLPDWSRGMPQHIQTGAGALGPPELERFK